MKLITLVILGTFPVLTSQVSVKLRRLSSWTSPRRGEITIAFCSGAFHWCVPLRQHMAVITEWFLKMVSLVPPVPPPQLGTQPSKAHLVRILLFLLGNIMSPAKAQISHYVLVNKTDLVLVLTSQWGRGDKTVQRNLNWVWRWWSSECCGIWLGQGSGKTSLGWGFR